MTHKYLTLEKRIEAELVSYCGKMSIYADDMKGNTIEIGIDEKFETASCIKLFILIALFNKIQKGEATLKEEIAYKESDFVNGSGLLRNLNPGIKMSVENAATLMIIVSDNIATNMMIDYLGIEEINEVTKELGFVNTVLHNKIDFAKYRQLGTSTVKDYAKALTLIAKGDLFSKEASAKMLEILRKQHYNNMLTRNLPKYFLDSENTGDEEIIFIGSKGGSMNNCRNDGGIITTPYGSYVVVMFTKEFHDPLYYIDHESSNFGAKVSRLFFDQYLALEGRFKPIINKP